MANSIILKKSSVPGKAPLAADLDYGELAINYTDGKIYYKRSDGTTVGEFVSHSYTISSAPPSNPHAWDVWLDSDTGIEFVYIVDQDSSQWVDLSSDSSGTPVFVQSGAPNYSGGPYLWIQTGVNGGFTIWVEDGV